MATSFVSAPVPLWAFNNSFGLPNVDGTLECFQDNNRSIVKQVFQDQAGTQPYSQPIPFGASAQRGPFYWIVNDPASADDVYFLKIKDRTGAIIKTIPGFQPAGEGGSAPVTLQQDFSNIIPNGQFRFVHKTSLTPLLVSQEIAYGGWFFEKGNTTAIDEIKFNTLGLSDTLPTLTPTREFEYNCTTAGAAESFKHIECRLQDVRTLQQEEIHVRLEAKFTLLDDALVVSLVQNFGTGGTPSATVVTPITTFTLLTAYSVFEINFTVPSLVAKVLGTNGDDFLALRLDLPLDAVETRSFDNIQITVGPNANVAYQYRSTNESVGELLPKITPNLTNRSLTINGAGTLEWGVLLPIGSIVIWSVPTIPDGFAICNGSILSKAEFPQLFAVLGDYYGDDASSFSIPDYRGRFIRGVDAGAGRDPDAATRTAAVNGTPTTVGSTQADEFKSHTHIAALEGGNTTQPAPGFILSANVGATSATGGDETRPINIYVIYIIKIS